MSRPDFLRRSLLRVIPVSILLTIAPSALALEQPKIACTRLGQSVIYRGKKFTCIRVKGKLVWDKGVLLPISKSSPSSSPSPSKSTSASATPSGSASPSTSPTATSSPIPPPSPTKVAFARSKDVPLTGTVVLNGKDQIGRPISVAFTRVPSGIVALEAFCTHSGCIVRPDGKELLCPCHYSTFDPTSGAVGNPLQQAAYPLPRIKAVEESGEIFLLF